MQSLWIFQKAFDSKDKPTLWKILTLFGCPDKLVNLVMSFHDDMNATVSVGGLEQKEACEARMRPSTQNH